MLQISKHTQHSTSLPSPTGRGEPPKVARGRGFSFIL